jgi:hypothetical protein
MIVLKNTETGKEIELTADELDAIYGAMGDYQDYGEEETCMMHTIRTKIYEI